MDWRDGGCNWAGADGALARDSNGAARYHAIAVIPGERSEDPESIVRRDGAVLK